MSPSTQQPEDISQLEKNLDQQTQNFSRVVTNLLKQTGADQSKVRALKDFATNSTLKNQEKFLQAGFTEKQVEELKEAEHLHEKAFLLRQEASDRVAGPVTDVKSANSAGSAKQVSQSKTIEESQKSAMWKALDNQIDETIKVAKIIDKNLDVFSELTDDAALKEYMKKDSRLVKKFITDPFKVSEEIKQAPMPQHIFMQFKDTPEKIQKIREGFSSNFSSSVPVLQYVFETLKEETKDLLSEGKNAKAESVEDLKLKKEKLGKYKEKYALLNSLDNEQFAFKEDAQKNFNLLDKEILKTDKQILDLEKQKSSIAPTKKAKAYTSSDKTSETISLVASEIATAYAQNFDTSVSPAERRAKRAALINQAAKLEENQIISIMDELKGQTTLRNGELYRKDMLFAAELAPHLEEPLQKKMLDFTKKGKFRTANSIQSGVGNDKVKEEQTQDTVTIPEQIVQQMVNGGKATAHEIMSLAKDIGTKISSHTASKISDEIQGNPRKRTVVDKAKDLFHNVTASPKTKVFKKYIKSAIAQSRVQ